MKEDNEHENKTSQKKKRKNHVVQSEVDGTIVKDATSFIDKVIEVRGLNRATVKCRVVPDKGQGSLKIVASVFDGDVDPDISFTKQEGKG